MDSPQCFQILGIERLHTDGDARNASCTIVSEISMFKRARIGFHGRFVDVLQERLGQNSCERVWMKQAWCAAAEIDGVDVDAGKLVLELQVPN